VPLHQIPQHGDIHIVTEQAVARRGIEPLRLRKSAGGEVVEEGALERRAFRRGQKIV
jgi:hypothetical protein